MKKEFTRRPSAPNEEMRTEYDFKSMKRGVRGKYYKDYRAGHTVKIHHADGTTIMQHFKLEEGVVVLEPDVRKYYPDSVAANKALRGLIALFPKKHGTK